jgi:hypothetical protein
MRERTHRLVGILFPFNVRPFLRYSGAPTEAENRWRVCNDNQQYRRVTAKSRKSRRIAYLVNFATVVYVNFAIHDRLIVENDAETARNILAHERLFRIGIVGNLIYCVGVVVLLTALYIILKPVNRALSLLAAFWRHVWVLMWLVMTLRPFDALHLLSSANYLRAFDAERLQAEIRTFVHDAVPEFRRKTAGWSAAAKRIVDELLSLFGISSDWLLPGWQYVDGAWSSSFSFEFFSL